jgi:hypothetical protein
MQDAQQQGSRLGRLGGRIARGVLRAVGGAVYYAIHRKLPDETEANPYWSEMHPDDDKGAAGEGRQRFQQPPPAI